MPPKPAEIYQGSDWLTYRWAVAQAFDTLDRIRDLCLQMPVAAASAPQTPRFDAPAEEIADMFGYIAELCDDLAGELDTIHADLCPFARDNMAHAWTAFEMRLYLKDLRRRALREAESAAAAPAPPDAILALADRIRTSLKQVDQ